MDVGSLPRAAASTALGRESLEHVAGEVLDLVEPEVTTVPPPGVVWTPSTAWPWAMRAASAGSRVPNSREAMKSSSDGSCGSGGRSALARVKCSAGAVASTSKVSGVPSAPVGYSTPSRMVRSQPSHS